MLAARPVDNLTKKNFVTDWSSNQSRIVLGAEVIAERLHPPRFLWFTLAQCTNPQNTKIPPLIFIRVNHILSHFFSPHSTTIKLERILKKIPFKNAVTSCGYRM